MKKLKEHKWQLLGIIVAAIILMMPLFINEYHKNDDTVYHVSNVIGAEQNIENFGSAGAIVPIVANDFGYGSRLLYPPLSQTTIAYVFHGIKHLGLTVLDAFRIVHFLVFAFSGITMYGLAYKLTKNKKIAFFSGLIYLTMPYQLADIYVRGALAECFLFPFLPMIFSGIVSLLDGDKKRFYPLFIFGYVGAVLSHFTVMIYFTILLGIMLLYLRKKVFKKEFLLPFFIACLFIFGMLLFFFEPMVYYKLTGGIAVFMKNVMTNGVYGSTLWPHEYLPITRYFDEIMFYFALIPLILAIITFVKRKELKFPRYTKGFLVFFCITLFISSKFCYWDFLPEFFLMIQFAWRLVAFLGLIFAILAPICLQKVNNKKILAGIYIGIIIISYFNIHYRSDDIVDLDVIITYHEAMGWQHEYLPENAYKNQEYFENRSRDIIYDEENNNAIFEVIEDNTPRLIFRSSEVENTITIELPRLYYIGYEIIDEEGNKLEVKESEYGFIEVEITSNSTFTLNYVETSTKKMANIISVSSFIIFIGWYGIYCYKNKEKEGIN